MIRVLLFVTAIIFSSCTSRESKTIVNNQASENSTESLATDGNDSLVLNGSTGILSFTSNPGGILKIYDENLSEIKEFDFGDPETMQFYSRLDSLLKTYRLFAYKPDYGLLQFFCDLEGDYYRIQTNDGKANYISTANNDFEFNTWNEYLLTENYLSINEMSFGKEISFYIQPDTLSGKIEPFMEDELYLIRANKVKNEWIEVEIECISKDDIRNSIGWIIWRDNKSLTIEFWHLL